MSPFPVETIVIGSTTGATFPVNLELTTVNALLDSGAQKNVLNYDTYERLGAPPLRMRVLNVVSATGGSLDPLGETQCEFDINGHKYATTFIVCRNLRRPMVLGLPFWRKHALGLQFTENKTRRLVSKGDTIIEVPDEEDKGIPIRLEKALRVPSRHYMVAAIDSGIKIPERHTLHISPHLQDKEPNLVCIPTCIQNGDHRSGKLLCNLINLQQSPIFIPKGEILGYLQDDMTEMNLIEINEIESEVIPPCKNWIPKRKQQTKLPTLPEQSAFLLSPADVEVHRTVKLPSVDMPIEMSMKLEALKQKYSAAFSQNSADIGRTGLIEMDIDTGDSPPVCQRPYTLALKHYQWVKGEIELLEKAGVIKQSTSPWASPIVIVPKKSGPGEPPRRRLCVDYRKINELEPEVKKAYSKAKGAVTLVPLPKIDELYALLKGAKIFSTLDLRSGYYHIRLSEASKAKTAFVTPFGKHQFEVVPFGLRQAPAFFQQLISGILNDIDFAFGYLDDIIIFSPDEETHLKHIEIILNKLVQAGLKLKESKCNFFKTQIQYLGHIVSSKGIEPLPEKCQAINEMPAPRNVKEIQIFTGMSGYYRKFVPRYSDIARPITDLTKKTVAFEWLEKCQVSFDMLKEFLMSEPILVYPDPDKPYYLYTDASKYAWAGVLTQLSDIEKKCKEEGKRCVYQPIQWVSGLFRGSQIGWAALTKEAHAIYRNVKRLSFYLEMAKTFVRSDHLPLKKFLYRNTLNSKVNNWAIELEMYHLVFEWIKGKENVLADVLSRLIKVDPDVALPPEEPGKEFGYSLFDLPSPIDAQNSTNPCEVDFIDMVCTTQVFCRHPSKWCQYHREDVELGEIREGVEIQLPITREKLIELQKADTQCQRLITKYEKGDLDDTMYDMREGILHKNVRDNKQMFHVVVLPQVLVEPALYLAHEVAGHNGSTRTYMALHRKYYWKGMKRQIYKHCKQCPNCRLINLETIKHPNLHFRVPTMPMQQIAMDLIGQFHPPSRRGNQFALTCICMLTGFVFCVPIPNKDMETVLKAYVNKVYAYAGGSVTILTDNGTEFKNKLFTQVATELGMEHKIEPPPFHPASNGRIEGFHRFLKACMTKHISKDLEWDDVADLATAAYNFFPNEHSKESAFYLMYGRDPITPLDKLFKPRPRYLGNSENLLNLQALHKIYQTVAEELTRARKRRDITLDEIPKQFRTKVNVGDLVALRNYASKTWEPKYKEAYRVIEKLGQTRLRIRDNNGKLLVVHITDVKNIDPVARLVSAVHDVQHFGTARAIVVDAKLLPNLQWKLPTSKNPYQTIMSVANTSNIPQTQHEPTQGHIVTQTTNNLTVIMSTGVA